jgi:hypothetical protein
MNIDEQTVQFIPECSQLDNTLSRLTEIFEMFPEARNDIVAFLESHPHIIEIDLDENATTAAGDLRVSLKPSDSFLSFMTALGARYG